MLFNLFGVLISSKTLKQVQGDKETRDYSVLLVHFASYFELKTILISVIIEMTRITLSIQMSSRLQWRDLFRELL